MSQPTPGGHGTPAARSSNFPVVTQLPSIEPQVILAFRGLMAMTFGELTGITEVGVHDTAPNHDLKIKVFDLAIGVQEPFYEFDVGSVHPSPLAQIQFQTQHEVPNTSGFYQPINFSFATSTHPRIIGDPFDFRQVNDFEGPEFYDVDEPLHQHGAVRRPRIMLPTGMFMTLVPTIHKFRRAAGPDSLTLGSVAEIVGAGIYLQPNGSVRLQFGPNEIKLPLKSPGDTLYLFLFDNSCPPDVCVFDPDSGVKENRNDFFEYYKMFDIPSGKAEFELILDERGKEPDPVPPTPGRTHYQTVADFLSKEHFKESNNEAPCGPVGFGGGG